MRNQGTRESLDYWRSLEAPRSSQVNARAIAFFNLTFENDDCSRARVLQNDAGARRQDKNLHATRARSVLGRGQLVDKML